MSTQATPTKSSGAWTPIVKLKRFPTKGGIKIAKVVTLSVNPEGRDFLSAEESPTGGKRTQITITLSPADEALLGLKLIERAKARSAVEDEFGSSK